ncbi:hypothetical protein L6164_012496 [Bauhinia variegata]|uniref:Uncharacterized protein n=1 Tax=Bauhinia variegata TaxID=167791 RepID=A0ACB9PFE6_BAUVA|nr:hypothetical protein L6164_012496 [Bauhinia variegata]
MLWLLFDMRTMISPSLHLSPSALHCFNPHRLPPFPVELKSSFPRLIGPKQKKVGYRTCRAHFSDDAPFVLAIGACMLSSLVLPISDGPEKDGDSSLDSTDTRFAVMAIVSFIPYFNWLSWVFAWLDTGKRRYAIYSLVYLAPYLRSNLSLSLEESWLPIASIFYGIIHVQLEASIRNGMFKDFKYLGTLQRSYHPLLGIKATWMMMIIMMMGEANTRFHG